jgi:biopolymer transport protein ExbD
MRSSDLAPLPPFSHTLQLCLLAPFLLLVVCFLGDRPGPPSPGPSVRLPFTSGAKVLPGSDAEIYVTVLPDGMLYIDRKWYPPAEFASRIREFGSRAPHKRLLLRADRALPFSVVRSVLRTLQHAGFNRVVLTTFEGSPSALMWRSAA